MLGVICALLAGIFYLSDNPGEQERVIARRTSLEGVFGPMSDLSGAVMEGDIMRICHLDQRITSSNLSTWIPISAWE